MIRKKDILNIMGSRCPDSIIKIRIKINKIKNGDLIFVISDDQTTKYEIPRFCTFMNHILLLTIYKSNIYKFLIQKKIIE
ncbi:sulfurtransferase TusA family protein [Buchnera aphidicola (Mollitrichosiphum nigrofasciatum)]|uniref:sulfurtransferase TusA family protein n=1 Tax=Buchnera aphidicola TaxID=9 RepID=UPI0031B800BE